ncbi:hypothetical protein Patl1_16227 [Pistacia atlantica]|uniref:Uncharacterized protein n=1 Tax=Pistacia atlantica TaxID=434234 RepID=A0ACC1B8I1_9ROSI|nr:hypothetical protein Patl1_16227 [Pistacia atlantica]
MMNTSYVLSLDSLLSSCMIIEPEHRIFVSQVEPICRLQFMCRLRLLAESKGYRLDDTGLFPATRGSGGKHGARASASLKFETEKEVFNFLGFPWLEPNERNL